VRVLPSSTANIGSRGRFTTDRHWVDLQVTAIQSKLLYRHAMRALQGLSCIHSVLLWQGTPSFCYELNLLLGLLVELIFVISHAVSLLSCDSFCSFFLHTGFLPDAMPR
jgi:hypothetical protein